MSARAEAGGSAGRRCVSQAWQQRARCESSWVAWWAAVRGEVRQDEILRSNSTRYPPAPGLVRSLLSFTMRPKLNQFFNRWHYRDPEE